MKNLIDYTEEKKGNSNERLMIVDNSIIENRLTFIKNIESRRNYCLYQCSCGNVKEILKVLTYQITQNNIKNL